MTSRTHTQNQPTLDSIRAHWGETQTGKDASGMPSDHELERYFSSMIFAIQMRLERIQSMVGSCPDQTISQRVFGEKQQIERELDLCREIVRFSGLKET